ncbi:MAG: glycosyltransferase [Verrucomicrobiae bacterium]|nr:glycosyltransferase [Verrucomicrobiae bacterium]
MTSPQNENQTFVFHDASGSRWPRVKLLALFMGILIFLAVLFFVRSLLQRPDLRLPSNVRQLQTQLQGLRRQQPPKDPASPKVGFFNLRHTQTQPLRPRSPASAPANSSSRITLAFYAGNDQNSLPSLRRHAGQITHLSPDWLCLKNEECDLACRPDPEVESLARERGIRILPLLTNECEGWRGDLIEALVTGPPEPQIRFIRTATGMAAKRHYAGLCVDFEGVAPEYMDDFNQFLIRFARECHKQQLLFVVCIPVGYDSQVFDLDKLAPETDYFLAMLYHENSRHDPSGPIASQPWFDRWLQHAMEFAEPGKWIIGMGAFGVDWPRNGPVGKNISFADAMVTAAATHAVQIETTQPEFNPTFDYQEDKDAHTVWFLDAVTILNQARSVCKTGAAGIALHRLGLEDPSAWDALDAAHKINLTPEDLRRLGELTPEDHITHVGSGEALRVRLEMSPGKRKILPSSDGHYIAQYETFPSYVVLEHYGKRDLNTIALTFDDGPDERWTPKILDILKKEKVPATFFILGHKAEECPKLVLRMLNEGHEIGNHSYTHPNMAEISDVQFDLELNATQRLLENLLGRSTLLFRPPYAGDAQPQTYQQILPILRAQRRGYITVCENIDPQDWSKPGVKGILKRIEKSQEDGNVILLHDGGGDRRQTVEALPKIIRWLRHSTRDQVQFVTASQLLGLQRDDVMPPAIQTDRMTIAASSLGLHLIYFLEEMLWAFMVVASLMTLARTMVVAWLAIRQKKRHADEIANWKTLPPTLPPVSVLIAAYNEEKVIVQTIRSILNNGYGGELEIIMINDGSTDRTREMIENAFPKENRLRASHQPNRGKSAALSLASQLARHPFLVTLDADTQLEPGAIAHLLRPMIESRAVGAVSGNAKVGNRGKWLTEFQSLEYVCGFNLDRRAYDELNCITVVPGAVGALRRQAVMEAGGITAETLAEDTDLTIQIRRLGWQVRYAEEAVGWTESPETLRSLVKQRFRWAFGTLQCLWKHRSALFNPKYGALGWFALPSMWFFQIALVAAAPMVDVLMLFSLFLGNGYEVALYFMAFIVSDVVLAALALKLEGENPWRAIWVIPQRFVYRPLLCLVVWNAVKRALRGALIGWGKIERTANVKLEPAR